MSLSADKVAMSKALGAAFLSHQVEQLERSVAEANWRGNRNNNSNGPGSRHTTTYTSSMNNRGGRGKHDSRPPRPKETRRSRDENALTDHGHTTDRPREKEKQADVVVADASLLIYGLSYLKKWSNPERDEVVIVPLEGVSSFVGGMLLSVGSNRVSSQL
jgi:hypothetical protein